jgi:Uma2 family endonuclease
MEWLLPNVEEYVMSDQLPEGYTLIDNDGVPLDSNWHRQAITLLCHALNEHWRLREDYFVGGNMFINSDVEQVRTWSYRGPDFFVVRDVKFDGRRRYWATWEEGGRYPDLIMELLSPRTAEQDRTTTKHLN